MNILVEFLKAATSPVLTVALAGFFGLRLSAAWNERQKRRELELALAERFYHSYGDFRSAWKEWAWALRHTRDKDIDLFNKQKACLLQKSDKAEGNLEAVLLKIASERKLTPIEAQQLGVLRQFFKLIRYSMQDDKPVPFNASEDENYLEFKRLSTFLGTLLARPSKQVPTAEEAYVAFREITNNKHEAFWAQRLKKLEIQS